MNKPNLKTRLLGTGLSGILWTALAVALGFVGIHAVEPCALAGAICAACILWD